MQPAPARVYTIREAAEATGLTEKALRNRVDRGQLRAVKHRDGLRRIPRVELVRAGLLEADDVASKRHEAALEPQQGASGEAASVSALLDRLERQAAELGRLRQLTKEAESLKDDRDRLESALHEERARAATAEAQARTAQEQAKELRELAESSWWTRRKLHRVGAATPPAGATLSPLTRT